jgi:cytochrome c biogenesis protein CcmG/thiol:disulfide interchange protein DsbE
VTISSLLAASRQHRLLAAVLITGVILAAIEIPYLVLARSGNSLQTIQAFGAPRWEDRPAPSFTLPALVGRGTISVGAPAGEFTVLNFWASWCTACRAEAPSLQHISSEHLPGVRFVGVDVGDRSADGRSFVRRFGITYPSGVDPHVEVASRYGIFGLPYTFVIDRSGHIRAEIAGRVSDSTLGSALARLQNS